MKNLTSSPPQRTGAGDFPPASAILDSGPQRTALIDSQGTIVAVNRHWTAPVKGPSVFARIGPGVNYLDVCRKASVLSMDARRAFDGIDAVLKERVSSFTMDYYGETKSGRTCFHMMVTPLVYRDARAVITHAESPAGQTSRERNFEFLEQFAPRFINAQEAERRRIAQELHDDLGNRLALMALSIRQLAKRSATVPGSNAGELHGIFDQVTKFAAALRDLSHGLHPPLIRHAGIKAALKALQESFEQAQSIHVQLLIVAEPPHLPEELALCMFRIAQEALQNAAKHSGCDSATVVIDRTSNEILLTVSDNGKGFVPGRLRNGGLGLLSMEARAVCVGGRLTVKSSPGAGTEIGLTIPFRESGIRVR